MEPRPLSGRRDRRTDLVVARQLGGRPRADQRPRDREHLLLAAGQRARVLIQALADPREQLQRAVADAGDAGQIAAQVAAELEALLDGEVAILDGEREPFLSDAPKLAWSPVIDAKWPITIGPLPGSCEPIPETSGDRLSHAAPNAGTTATTSGPARGGR
jgi:hypothetical protein